MNALAVDQASPGFGGFYVPQFEILIDGVDLAEPVLRDVIEVSYTDNIDELD